MKKQNKMGGAAVAVTAKQAKQQQRELLRRHFFRTANRLNRLMGTPLFNSKEGHRSLFTTLRKAAMQTIEAM